jgi:leucyl-tRNA synthetase
LQETVTCDPSYYKHTQSIFLKLFQTGAAYQAEDYVNWDPVDGTVLANEQVDANGHSWRSGAKVERRLLKQWFIAFGDLKERLLSGLDSLSKNGRWPERVVAMQKNWIGMKRGTSVDFTVHWSTGATVAKTDIISVWTSRLDTLLGVQYIALSLDHPIVKKLARDYGALRDFIEKCETDADKSKLGYRIPGAFAQNEIVLDVEAGRMPKKLPIFVASYVLGDFGSGALMGVPAHDHRDFAFWKENGEGLPALPVIRPDHTGDTNLQLPFVEKGVLNERCWPFSGISSSDIVPLFEKFLSATRSGRAETHWRLRDWLISRQRYWGTPIPIVHCKTCKAVPVPLEELPVVLPELPPGSFQGRGGNPLERIEDWVNTKCPKCGGAAKRETDTMDTFMDSSWYFFRFTDPDNHDEPFSKDVANSLVPVDYYIGGVEHAILHLLYARLMTEIFVELGMWDSKEAEPFKRLITQGMVHGRTYSDPSSGLFLKHDELDLSDPASPRIKSSGAVARITFEKMSKSKHNGVDPAKCMEKYGADATRAHILFLAPETETLEWREEPIVGIIRSSLRDHGPRAYTLSCESGVTSVTNNILHQDNYTAEEAFLLARTKSTIQSITSKLQAVTRLNTVISDLLKLSNALDAAYRSATSETPSISANVFYLCTSVLIRLMAPIVPAWAEESWSLLRGIPSTPTAPGDAQSVFHAPWPTEEEVPVAAAMTETIKTVVQFNGRRKFEVSVALPQKEVFESGQEKVLEKYMLQQVFELSDLGRKWWHSKESLKSGKNVERVVIANGGKVVNLVLKKHVAVKKSSRV